jgi:hypothetical protein
LIVLVDRRLDADRLIDEPIVDEGEQRIDVPAGGGRFALDVERVDPEAADSIAVDLVLGNRVAVQLALPFEQCSKSISTTPLRAGGPSLARNHTPGPH